LQTVFFTASLFSPRVTCPAITTYASLHLNLAADLNSILDIEISAFAPFSQTLLIIYLGLSR